VPAACSIPAHSLEDCVVDVCQNIRNVRGGRVTTRKSHMRILAEIEQLDVKEPIRDSI